MIGLLNGKIEVFDRPYVTIDVNGVGYRVLVSDRVYSLLAKEVKTKLFIYTHVREDEITLFGFLEAEDLKLFENLISVSGIGPKTALNIFSFGARNEIFEAIIKADTSFFSSVPRLGTKNAQKIIIELKSKMGGLGTLDLSGKDAIENDEIILALKTFGFSTSEAKKALSEIKEKNLTTEQKIVKALKYLGK